MARSRFKPKPTKIDPAATEAAAARAAIAASRVANINLGAMTGRQATSYALALVPAGLLPTVVGLAGGYYFAGALALGLFYLAVYARLSLGRNIGFVPAQRQIVTTGAYGFVRHPIYTGGFVNYIALLLLRYSRTTAILVGLGIFWFLLKSIVEEHFLRTDPEYSAYMARVRHRWIPWVV